MSHIRYKIHTISAQALIAYAKGYNADPDRYHYHLNKRETESTIVRQGVPRGQRDLLPSHVRCQG